MTPLSFLADGGAAFLVFLFPLFFLLLAVVSMVFWVWMLVDCITNKRLTDTDRIIWVLVIVFLHFVGGLLYHFLGRNGSGRNSP